MIFKLAMDTGVTYTVSMLLQSHWGGRWPHGWSWLRSYWPETCGLQQVTTLCTGLVGGLWRCWLAPQCWWRAAPTFALRTLNPFWPIPPSLRCSAIVTAFSFKFKKPDCVFVELRCLLLSRSTSSESPCWPWCQSFQRSSTGFSLLCKTTLAWG